MALFNVTYEIVTQESAEHGDFEESGFICEGFSLRDAIVLVNETRTSRVDRVECIECDSLPCTAPRWITVLNGMECVLALDGVESLEDEPDELDEGLEPEELDDLRRILKRGPRGSRVDRLAEHILDEREKENLEEFRIEGAW